ncbi:hypothetical protein [Actinospongicola halichondriae]|uniref:hypothetical protein n=1 Tax=Actinospongicola halichondriae TaxID=3236844 RepID=UPI003D58FD5C
MRFSRRTLVATISGLLLGGLLLAGCGGDDSDETSADDAIESVTDDGASDDGASDSGDGDTGDDSVSQDISAELPDDFPDAVYLPDGYRLLDVTEQSAGDRTAYIVNIGAGNDFDSLEAELRDAYDVEPEVNEQEAFSAFSFQGVDGLDIRYTFGPEQSPDGDLSVLMHVTPAAG